MQTYSLRNPALWHPIEGWPHRPCVEALVSSMQSQGYSVKCIYLAVRTAGRFVKWVRDQDTDGNRGLTYADVEHFIVHRAATGELRNGERSALKRLRDELTGARIIAPPRAPYDPCENLLVLFVSDLRWRGYREKSIASYLWFCARFLREVWNGSAGVAHLTSMDVRGYVECHAGDRSTSTAKIMCSRIRVFLRVLWSRGHIAEDLAASIPIARNIRLTSLPSYMSQLQVERTLSACDRSTVAGRRDYAVILLLARLGLRASEVARLTLDDIDWRTGIVRVHGKGGRIATMPLPYDVGAAIVEYIQHGRPWSNARAVFHRVDTPCTPFASATPVILIARRALKRAGVTGLASQHSHVFRHTLATSMIRSGASLTEIGQVLRHQQPDTTRIYAKVDVEGLRALCLPWPVGVQ